MSAEAGFQMITAVEMHNTGLPTVIDRIRSRLGDGPAYLSFDIDFVDPAFAPGTGTPEVGGFSSAQSLELVRGLSGLNFVGYDLVEVMPSYDPAGITSLLAANIVYEFISLIAQRAQTDRVP
jgi:agmatinase